MAGEIAHLTKQGFRHALATDAFLVAGRIDPKLVSTMFSIIAFGTAHVIDSEFATTTDNRFVACATPRDTSADEKPGVYQLPMSAILPLNAWFLMIKPQQKLKRARAPKEEPDLRPTLFTFYTFPPFAI